MNRYLSSGFFLLRTPLFPFEEFLKLCPPADADDRASSRARLREWAAHPQVQAALWLASPEFLEAISWWWKDPESAKGQKLERSLYRYLARMTARATPFGLFAGCSLGSIVESESGDHNAGDVTCLQLAPRSEYRLHSRLDMEYMCALAEAIAADRAARARLSFHPNTTLHLVAGNYHHTQSYVNPRSANERARLFQLVATGYTPCLEATLRRALDGATAHWLVLRLIEDDPTLPLEEVEVYVDRLIESQLLVADLNPAVTGPEPLDDMIQQLEQAGLKAPAQALRAIRECLRTAAEGGVHLNNYKKITEAVGQLPAGFARQHLIQADVIKPVVRAHLDQQVVDDILRAVEVLHSIEADSSQPELQQFKDDFQQRYQEREVPLLEALDDEAGIGFESNENPAIEPLLAGIDFRRPEDQAEASISKAESALKRKLETTLAESRHVLDLDQHLLEELKGKAPLPLPDAFAAIGILFSQDGKHGFHLQSVTGPSGVALFGRFCHADAQLSECVKSHLRAEEALQPEKIFAEISHLPEGRAGNVICRPVLRRYEIPYLASSRVAAEQQIPLSDLTVSLRGGRIVLRSQRLQREVLPRLTSAHDFSTPRNLKLYKFLCLLQQQGTSSDLSWNWRGLEQAAFLPRVAMGNIVFARARWMIQSEVAEQFRQEQGAGRLRRVREWRAVLSVPRFVYLTESDNQLLIDFENSLSVEAFVDYVSKRPVSRLVEMFPGPEALVARGPEGSFVHEIVVPFVRNPKPAPAAAPVRAGAAAQATPSASAEAGPPPAGFMPESGWLFAKLYCSPSHADRLLLELVKPLVQESQSAGYIDRWFFVRYEDPNWHLRLRLHGDPGSLKLHVLPRLREWATQHLSLGTLWRLQFDAYERETERYGGAAAIGIAERLFQLDSEMCLEFMELVSKDQDTNLRWRLAFYGVDRLLSGLGFTMEERRAIAEDLAESHEQSYVVDEVFRKQVASRFREERSILAALCGGPDTTAALPESALVAFRSFSIRLEEIRQELDELCRAGGLTTTMRDLAVDFVHMHLNRMLLTAHHAQETVLYNFLARIYAAKSAT
ncbi:MAG TPA: lantibiotic dehydratase [Candidatus Angelobacter sp.]|nr:lantibiotic dehydratase [Candidatus Angelobacter sp.]